MKTYYVMYDSRCGLCTEAKDWLRSQPTHVDMRLLASGSDEARRKFPTLPSEELAVVSSDGDVWLGDHAFIVCLWALRDYRNWARRLASPLLRPMARQAFAAVCQNRRSVSRLLGLKSETELKNSLSDIEIPSCPIQ